MSSRFRSVSADCWENQTLDDWADDMIRSDFRPDEWSAESECRTATGSPRSAAEWAFAQRKTSRRKQSWRRKRTQSARTKRNCTCTKHVYATAARLCDDAKSVWTAFRPDNWWSKSDETLAPNAEAPEREKRTLADSTWRCRSCLYSWFRVERTPHWLRRPADGQTRKEFCRKSNSSVHLWTDSISSPLSNIIWPECKSKLKSNNDESIFDRRHETLNWIQKKKQFI